MLAEYQEKIAFYFDEVTRFASPFRKGALSLEAWVEVCKGNIKTAGRIPTEGPKKEGVTAWDKVKRAYLTKLGVRVRVRARARASPSPKQVKKAYLTKCDGDEPLIGDFTVKRESEITGDERTRERFSCRLTLLEAKFAFLNSQDLNQMKAGDAENDDAMATLDLKEFTECICRCGRDKYNECKPMSLAERVRGFILNLLGEKGEEAVMRDATYISAERYDWKLSKPLNGQSIAKHRKWLDAWQARVRARARVRVRVRHP